MTDAGTAGSYTIRPLSADTWEAYAALAEKHNGVWGGCFCTWFHPRRKDEGLADVVEAGRPYKELLVREGRAHAALVFDGDTAVAWCQYGTPEELPNIYHRREYLAGLEQAPDYRTTCFFVDRDYRRHGLALVALQGGPGPHRAAGRRRRGGISAGHAWREDVGVVPLQRHAHRLRGGGLRVRAQEGHQELRDAYDGRRPLIVCQSSSDSNIARRSRAAAIAVMNLVS